MPMPQYAEFAKVPQAGAHFEGLHDSLSCTRNQQSKESYFFKKRGAILLKKLRIFASSIVSNFPESHIMTGPAQSNMFFSCAVNRWSISVASTSACVHIVNILNSISSLRTLLKFAYFIWYVEPLGQNGFCVCIKKSSVDLSDATKPSILNESHLIVIETINMIILTVVLGPMFVCAFTAIGSRR